IILARAKSDAVPDSMPSPMREVVITLNRVWAQSQAEFAASIPGARLITVADTTHYIHNQRPDVVIDAIRQVIAQATRRATTRAMQAQAACRFPSAVIRAVVYVVQ